MRRRIPKALLRVYRFLRNSIKIGSLQSVITISFTAVTILSMLLIGLAFYSTFSENAEKNAASSSQQIMDQATINLENYLVTMMDISDLIQNNLSRDSDENTKDLHSLFSLTMEIRKDIVTVAVFDENGNIIVNSPGFAYDHNYVIAQQDWFKGAQENPAKYIFQPPHVQRLFESRRPWVVSLCRGVTVYRQGVPVTWVVMVDMNFSVIEQLCSRVSLGQRGYIYVIDQAGNIIYHPQQQLIYTGLKEENISGALSNEPGSHFENFQGEVRITTIKDIHYTGWKMVGASFVDELVANKENFNNLIFYILLFGIGIEVLGSMFISSKISQPVKKLEYQMNKVENGDFDIGDLEVKGEDEVKRLTKAFNVMIRRIKQLMNQIISEQEAIRKSELKALQAQINPHFLYNTLDSIIWMNENRNYKGVTEMTAALAKFFRISISKGNEIIGVGDEIEHARSYLVIQKIRYKNKFDFSIDAEQDTYNHKTLKLVLQPIIENAIYHGINKIQEKGEISIKVFIQDGKLVFQVSDNGYGIKPEHLKGILNREPSSEHSSGVGLKNVNERIKLYYGSGYGVDIASEIEVGTTVSIWIPLTEPENGGGHNEIS